MTGSGVVQSVSECGALSYMVHSIVKSSGYILNTDFARTQEQQEDNSEFGTREGQAREMWIV